MKKIIIFIFALFSILILNISPVHAYIPDNTYYYGKTDLIDYEISNDGLYYTNTLMFRFTSLESNDFPNDYDYGVTSLLEVFNVFKDYKLNEYQFYSINKYIFANDDTLLLLRAGQVIDTIGNPNRIMFDLEGDSIRFEDKNGYAIYVLNYIDFNVSDIFTLKTKRYFYPENMYNEGYYDGYNDGLDDGYNDGLNENREYFGIDYNGNWLTAEQWGDIRYDDGYNVGLSGEIDWFSWSMTFFLMPFRILNIEILPGVRIGYFALFSLLLGVVGWFFFIVGKGGGRRR